MAWFAELHRLDEKKLAAVAKTLGVTPDQVRAARHPLTPLEHLHSLRSQRPAPASGALGRPRWRQEHLGAPAHQRAGLAVAHRRR